VKPPGTRALAAAMCASGSGPKYVCSEHLQHLVRTRERALEDVGRDLHDLQVVPQPVQRAGKVIPGVDTTGDREDADIRDLFARLKAAEVTLPRLLMSPAWMTRFAGSIGTTRPRPPDASGCPHARGQGGWQLT
jgi:hypothetical protein